jgi:hypothetical protein
VHCRRPKLFGEKEHFRAGQLGLAENGTMLLLLLLLLLLVRHGN